MENITNQDVALKVENETLPDDLVVNETVAIKVKKPKLFNNQRIMQCY